MSVSLRKTSALIHCRIAIPKKILNTLIIQIHISNLHLSCRSRIYGSVRWQLQKPKALLPCQLYAIVSQKHNQHRRSEIFRIAFLLHNAPVQRKTIYMTRCDLFLWKFCCEVIINATSKTSIYRTFTIWILHHFALHCIGTAMQHKHIQRVGLSDSYRFLTEI